MTDVTVPWTDPRAWAGDAACRGRLDLFYAPHAERPAARAGREAAARRVCASCPVRDRCRTHARTHGELGLWGGETESERTAAGFAARATVTLAVRRPRRLAG